MHKISVHDEVPDFPLACIDCTDESLVRPFREFLEAYGTEVLVNKTSKIIPNYHLVIGDPEFVKRILSSFKKDGSKRLLVIYNSEPSNVKNLCQETESHVVLIDPKLPDSRVVNQCFAFFFTGKKELLDLRTDKTDKPKIEKKIPETGHQQSTDTDVTATDKRRIQESIDSIFSQSVVPEKLSKLSNKQAVHQNSKHVSTNKYNGLQMIIWFFFAICIILASPFIWYAFSVGSASAALYVGASQIYSGNLNDGDRTNAFARNFIRQGKTALTVVAIPFYFTGHDKTVRGQERLLSFLDNAAGSISEMGKIMKQGKDVASLLLTQAGGATTSGSPALAIEKLHENLLAIENKLSFAQAELSILLTDDSFPFRLSRVRSFGTRGLQQLKSVHRNISYLDNFLTLYPELSGFKDKKTYLILFQNSMELRPTGGFIGSLATATFEQGRLANLAIQDVYDVDGQLKGHVDPPPPIREQLNEEHWYLRDSNWDPDFAKSGAKAAWFFQKETGKSVDGVIAVSSSFLVDILNATGALELPDYNDRITADNFFGKSLYYTQTAFFPGSTQKKDFLGNLANALVIKLTTAQGTVNPKLFTAVAGALERGDILLMFSDPEEQAVVTRFNWGGRIPAASTCDSNNNIPCFFDTLSVVDANFGVNKVNYYIQRFQQNQITLGEDGSVTTSVSLSYRNTSSGDHPSAGGGIYKVYSRFLLPPDAALTGVTLGDNKLPIRNPKKPPPPLPYAEIDTSNPLARTVGMIFLVPQTSEQRVVLTYKRERLLQFGPNGAVYDFLLTRQPGLMNTTVQTSIVYPIFWEASQEVGDGTLTFLAKQGRLEYNYSLSHNQEIRLRLFK